VVVTADTPQAGARILAIGEVKATRSPVGLNQLQRLEHIRTLLPPTMTPAPTRDTQPAARPQAPGAAASGR
jgi:hypothetical protein